MPARKQKPNDIDPVDNAILQALREDGRISYRQLADLTGLSARACLERVRRLEKNQVIRGYTALLDPAAFGHEIIALAAVELRGNAAPLRPHLERVLIRSPHVVELQVVSGAADYLARVVSPSLDDYERLTASWLQDPDLGIARIVTTFVLRSLKEFSGYPPGEPSGRGIGSE